MMFIRVPVHTYVSYHYLQKPRFKYAGTHVRVLGYVLSGLRYFMQFRVCRACMGVGVVGCGCLWYPMSFFSSTVVHLLLLLAQLQGVCRAVL